MSVDELADLLSDHGEHYDASGYYGCDCGFACGALEHPRHVAEVLTSRSPDERAAVAAEIRREGQRALRLAVFHPHRTASAAEPYERAAEIVETWEAGA